MQGYAYPPLSKNNKVILSISGVLMVLGLVLSLMGNNHLYSWLGLSVPNIASFKIYTLFTYFLMSNDPVQFLFNALLFWFVGSELDFLWGSKKYLIFLLVAGVGGGIIFLFIAFILGIGFPLVGPVGLANALCLAYAWHFPERPFSFFMLFPIPAKIFCWIIVALQVYAGLRSPGQVASWGHLGAMAASALYLYLLKIMAGGGFRRFKIRKNSLHIVPKDEDGQDPPPPKYWN